MVGNLISEPVRPFANCGGFLARCFYTVFDNELLLNLDSWLLLFIWYQLQVEQFIMVPDIGIM